MFLRVASDLHLEQFQGQREEVLVKQFLPEDERDSDSVLALAGDISSKPDQLVAFIQAVEKRFKKVIFVSGNHEIYRHEFHAWNTTMDKRFSEETSNLIWANNTVNTFELEGTRFIFTPLWADGGNPQEREAITWYMNDFRVITIKENGNYRNFTVQDMVKLHKSLKAKLIEFLQVPFDGNTVVITHHMPSYRLCHPRFGTECNGGFASNCDVILASDYAPAVWCGGHSHDNMKLYLWETLYVANPAGYVSEKTSPFNHFQPVFIDLNNIHG